MVYNSNLSWIEFNIYLFQSRSTTGIAILKAKKWLIQQNKNTPDSFQEHTKKAENSFGDLPEKQEAAPLPETDEPQPLNESSPTQTQSQPLFNFTKTEVSESIYKAW